jgi:hypothetical protein
MLGRYMSLLSKINTKRFFWPHTNSGFCGLATQNTAKITLDWLKTNLHWSLSYIHPNYFFYCLLCVCRVCPNLSSAPCTNDLIVAASGKKYMTIQGLELGPPAQVSSTVTTTPLRMTWIVDVPRRLFIPALQ